MKKQFVKLCQDHGVLLASVEVRGGFGRTLRIRWYQVKGEFHSINVFGFDLDDAWSAATDELKKQLGLPEAA